MTVTAYESVSSGPIVPDMSFGSSPNINRAHVMSTSTISSGLDSVPLASHSPSPSNGHPAQYTYNAPYVSDTASQSSSNGSNGSLQRRQQQSTPQPSAIVTMPSPRPIMPMELPSQARQMYPQLNNAYNLRGYDFNQDMNFGFNGCPILAPPQNINCTYTASSNQAPQQERRPAQQQIIPFRDAQQQHQLFQQPQLQQQQFVQQQQQMQQQGLQQRLLEQQNGSVQSQQRQQQQQYWSSNESVRSNNSNSSRGSNRSNNSLQKQQQQQQYGNSLTPSPINNGTYTSVPSYSTVTPQSSPRSSPGGTVTTQSSMPPTLATTVPAGGYSPMTMSVMSETIQLPPLIREEAVMLGEQPIVVDEAPLVVQEPLLLEPNGFEECTTAMIDPLSVDVPTVVEESVSVTPGATRTRTVIAHPPVIVPAGAPVPIGAFAPPPPVMAGPTMIEEIPQPLPAVPAPPVFAGAMPASTVSTLPTVQAATMVPAMPATYRFVDLLVPVRGPPPPRNTLERVQRRLGGVQPAQMQRIRTIVPTNSVYGG